MSEKIIEYIYSSYRFQDLIRLKMKVLEKNDYYIDWYKKVEPGYNSFQNLLEDNNYKEQDLNIETIKVLFSIMRNLSSNQSLTR